MTPATSARLDATDQLASLPFFLVHLLAVATPFLFGWSWPWAAAAVALYFVRMVFVTIGYHRYFSHRTFRTSRAFQLLLAFAAMTSSQKGVLWWASHHRDHHRYSDTDDDIHSPKQGFWWSHVGWFLARRYHQTDQDKIRDFAKFPELRWLDRHYLVPPLLYGIALFLAGGWQAVFWGAFVSTVLLWHGTFLVNSLAHVWGSRRYATADTSRNNLVIALFTSGEGWHNNHHHHLSSANQGFFWWEVDPSFAVIRAWQAVGLVWDVKRAPDKVRRDTIAARARREQGTATSAVAVA